jgi:hypothetical protein
MDEKVAFGWSSLAPWSLAGNEVVQEDNTCSSNVFDVALIAQERVRFDEVKSSSKVVLWLSLLYLVMYDPR